MDTNGFHGDTFSGGFGDFYTAKRGVDKAGLGWQPLTTNYKYYHYFKKTNAISAPTKPDSRGG